MTASRCQVTLELKSTHTCQLRVDDKARGASHLIGQDELFRRREPLRQLIDDFRESDSLLPNNEIFVTLSFHARVVP